MLCDEENELLHHCLVCMINVKGEAITIDPVSNWQADLLYKSDQRCNIEIIEHTIPLCRHYLLREKRGILYSLNYLGDVWQINMR